MCYPSFLWHFESKLVGDEREPSELKEYASRSEFCNIVAHLVKTFLVK